MCSIPLPRSKSSGIGNFRKTANEWLTRLDLHMAASLSACSAMWLPVASQPAGGRNRGAGRRLGRGVSDGRRTLGNLIRDCQSPRYDWPGSRQEASNAPTGAQRTVDPGVTPDVSLSPPQLLFQALN